MPVSFSMTAKIVMRYSGQKKVIAVFTVLMETSRVLQCRRRIHLATTDLKLDEPGTLTKPAPIDRIVRLGFSLLCLFLVADLLLLADLMEGNHVA